MLKILREIVLWIYAISTAFVIQNIIVNEAAADYTGVRGKTEVIVGCLLIAAVSELICLVGYKRKWLGFLAYFSAVLAWVVIRRRILKAGFDLAVYSIAGDVAKAYGYESNAPFPMDITGANIKEAVLFATAVVTPLVIYLIKCYDSMYLAVAFTVVLCMAEALLNITPGISFIILICSLVSIRYIMLRKNRNTSLFTGIMLPTFVMVMSVIIAYLACERIYEMGLSGQDKLIEIADSIVNYAGKSIEKGIGKKGISEYYNIDGNRVELSDDIVMTIELDEKPDTTYYYTTNVFNSYNDGTWSLDMSDEMKSSWSDDSSVDVLPEVYMEIPSDSLDMLCRDIELLDYDIMPNEEKTAVIQKKAAVITEFIQQRTSYTTNPGGYDNIHDPVISFLYYVKKGYCVHYATTAALSLRMAGEYTRYITGYAIPVSSWRMDETGKYSADIQESYGHAWTEVYNPENDVWILIEATPGYNGPENTDSLGEHKEDSKDEKATENLSSDEDTHTEEDTEDITSEANSEENNSDYENAPYDFKDGESDSSQMGSLDNIQSEKNRKIPEAIVWTAAAALAVLAVFIMLFLRRRIIVVRRRKKLRGTNRRSAIYIMSECIYDMMEYSGIIKGFSMDDLEYAEAVEKKFDFLKNQIFIEFTCNVQASVYGDIAPKASDMEKYLKMYRLIRAHVFYSLSFYKRFVWKLIKCYD